MTTSWSKLTNPSSRAGDGVMGGPWARLDSREYSLRPQDAQPEALPVMRSQGSTMMYLRKSTLKATWLTLWMWHVVAADASCWFQRNPSSRKGLPPMTTKSAARMHVSHTTVTRTRMRWCCVPSHVRTVSEVTTIATLDQSMSSGTPQYRAG